MKAAIQMNRALAPEELLLVNGGVGEADNLSIDNIAKILFGPFITIIKKIIGPILPSSFEVFYAIVNASIGTIEMMISKYNIVIWIAFQAYLILPDAMKRLIWKAVYDALKAQMPMAG